MSLQELRSSATWYVLPAVDAHHSRLPADNAGACRRAIRLASVRLLRDCLDATPYAAVRSVLAVSAPVIDAPWQGACLAAGARCFSAALRRTTGSAVANELLARMGAASWRSALRWEDAAFVPVLNTGGHDAVAVVECTGSELLLDELGDAQGHLRTRVRLRFSEALVQHCALLLPAPGSACRRRIALAVLKQDDR